MSDIVHTDIVVEDHYPRVSWGALFAGLVVVLSLGWLLDLLGLAMGVSIADAYDSATMEGGLDESAGLWMILCWIVVFFIGAMVTARLAGAIDDLNGMLHGLVLWGVASLAMFALAFYSIGSMVGMATKGVSATASGVATTLEGAGSSMVAVGGAAEDALTSDFALRVQDRLTDRAIEMTAGLDKELTPAEIRQAVNNLDQRTLRRLTRDLTDKDTEGAAQLLADSTELSIEDSEALVNGVYAEMEEMLGNPENEASLAQDMQNQFARQADTYVAALDARGGADVTRRDIRQAIRNLDAAALKSMAVELVSGDAEGAKQVLVRNTDLSRDEINELYEGASNQIEAEIDSYQQKLNEWVATVADYTQGILWVTFGGNAIALVMSLGGGWLGAHSSRETYAHVARDRHTPVT